MRKTILLSVFALSVLTINAQTAVVKGGGFWDNWSIGIQGGATMKMSGTGFFKSARPAWGLNVGKQWTPILGMDIQGMGPYPEYPSLRLVSIACQRSSPKQV